MVSQKDVARRAHVSFMTVSRVVNNHNNVKLETRERVLQAIQELSYYPNAVARALNSQKTRNVGIIFQGKESALERPYFIELCVELEDHLSRHGYHLFLGAMMRGTDRISLPALFRERKVDGLVMLAPHSDEPSIEKLAAEGFPFVIVHGRHEKIECPYVDTDNLKGISTIVRYLFDLGHRQIGFICGNMHEVNAQDRFAGYRTEIGSLGLDYDAKLVCPGDWTLDGGYTALNTLFAQGQHPTAIVCSNDQMAIGAMKAAHERSMRIPEDLSITGFDDIKYAAFVTPALTTVRQPLKQVADVVVDLILQQIAGSDQCRQVVLQPEFVIRSSCRSPGSSAFPVIEAALT